MKSQVALVRCASYEPEEIEESLDQLLALLGGMDKYVSPGMKTLLKPNMLKSAAPEKAVTTHPAFLKAVANRAKTAGAEPFVGDSPAFGSVDGVAKASGIEAAARELGLPVVKFNRPARVKPDPRAPISGLMVDRAALEADAVINLPKLKTHQQLALTCGVKNLFGCVSGKRKAVWHLTGGNHKVFPYMLIEVVRAVAPKLTLVDAVTAMEGNGPGNGSPKHVGLLIGSADPVAIDRVVCEIIGLPPENFSILQAARELEVGATELKDIEVVGEQIKDIKIPGFVLSRPVPIGFSLPRVAKSVWKNVVVTSKEG